MTDETDASEVSLGAETAKATAAKFSMAAVGFAGTIIFARILGPERFGAYYLLFALVQIVGLPIEGWAMAAKKRFSESGARTGEIVGGQFLFVLGWVLVGSIGAFVLGQYVVSYTGISEAVPLFVALFAGEAVYVSAERLLQSRGLVGKATWTDAFRSYVTFVVQLGLVLTGWGVAGMAYGLAFASFAVTPVTIYLVGTSPSIPSRETLHSQWEYARYSLISSLFGRVYERFDILLLGYLLGPTAAGWYEVAYKLVTPAKFVADAASSGLMARVSVLLSRGEEIGEDVTNVLSFSSILSIPIFFGGLAIAEPLVTVTYGPEYRAAAPLLVVIALYHVVTTQSMVFSQTIYGMDSPGRVMWVSAVAVLINVILGLALVPTIGPVGVALATLVAEITMYVAFSLGLRSTSFQISFFPSAVSKQLFAGLVMFVTVHAIRSSAVTPLKVASYITVGGVVYFLVLLSISRGTRRTAQSILSDIVAR